MINTYLDLLDIFIYDVDTNFDSAEFWAEAKMLSIICYQISVEAYWSIEKLKNIMHLYNIYIILFEQKQEV